MPTRPIYSESHDDSLFPKKGKRGRRRASIPAPPVNKVPPLPDTQIGFLPKNLSDQQRIDLRARQLMAERSPTLRERSESTGMPLEPPRYLEDEDLKRDVEDVRRPRDDQWNQVDGVTVFQNVQGPRLDRLHTRVFSEDELHPGLPDFAPSEFDPADAHAARELIAAVSAEDQMILAFDNELTTMHTTLRRLRQKAQQMAQSVARQDDNPKDANSPTAHAQNVVQLIATILEPWFLALDDEFSQLLNATEQGRALEEAEQ